MENSEKALLNCIAQIHQDISSFVESLGKSHPKIECRIDLSMYSTDIDQNPSSPVGCGWEINLDEHDEYFFMELIHDSKWQLNAEHSRIRQETITEFFAFEFEESFQLINAANELTEKFIECCLIKIEQK